MKRLILGLVLLGFISCKTIEYVQVPVETVRTEYITVNTKDTLIQKDSVDRYIKGDSVVIYKYKYIYKVSERLDTIIQIDTISVPYALPPEIHEVNILKGWQKFLMACGAAAILLVVYRIYRKFRI